MCSSDEDVTDISGDEGSDIDKEPVSEAKSEENSDVENSSDEADELVSKNGLVWDKELPVIRQTPRHNIIRWARSLPMISRANQSPKEIFDKIFTSDMKEIMIRWTNQRGAGEIDDWEYFNLRELEAFLGLLILMGVHRESHTSLDDVWSEENRPYFRATMTLRRFKQILRFCRFDDFDTREERRSEDKLAAFREFWTKCQESLLRHYQLGNKLTIDEQMCGTRGRCGFRQYIHGKPDKYGIKIIWVVDSENSYPLQGEIYLGQQPHESLAESKERNKPINYAKRLTSHWQGLGFSVTADNLWGDIQLATDFMVANTSLVCTVRKNNHFCQNKCYQIDTANNTAQFSEFEI